MPDAHRFELILDAIVDDAVYMVDPDGLVVTWNLGAETLIGYTAEEIVGRHFSLFFSPPEQAKGISESWLYRARIERRHEAETWCVRKDGSRFLCHASVQRIDREDRGLLGFVVIAGDIGKNAAAQETLRDREDRFRMLVEATADHAICMLDPRGLVVNWNPGAERLKGYRAEEIIGQHFSVFYTPEDRAAGVPEKVLEIAAGKGRFEGEGWRVREDGSRFWALIVVDAIHDKEGRLTGFAKITRDITERRVAQEALRDSERQFRLLVASVTDYALFMLDPNGIVNSWNAGAQRIKGYAADEIIGQHFSRFYPEPDRAAGVPLRGLTVAAQEGRWEAEGWRVRKDGSLFWANAIIDAIRDEDGKLIGFAKITRDITERRETQIALDQAQQQLAYSQKMDALGQLTGGVAHDFNNLLMVVSGNVQLLKQSIGGDQRVTRAVDAIGHAADRGQTLMRQLLTFSRRHTVNPTVFALDARVDTFRTMISSSLGSAVTLATSVGPDIWPVRVDPNELELALVNIVLNARDAMPDGGEVSIAAENVVLAAAETPAGIAGEFVALRIRDTGIGIAPDVLLKVFDPFFTTKPIDKGSGLGLSQVYGFAGQSGGTVTIESVLGQGTTLTLYLPRGYDAPQAAEHDRDADTTGGGTVLVVEDNSEVADVTASMLDELGYRVKTVGNAAAALDAVAEQAFDLVISDIVMPGRMGGLDLARALRQQSPHLPVLLVTGYSHMIEEARADFPVLPKPFRLAELSRMTARAIAEAKQPLGGNVVRLDDVRAPGASTPRPRP